MQEDKYGQGSGYKNKKRKYRKEDKKMGMNPAAIMKLMSAKNKLLQITQSFLQFLNAVFSRGIEEGTIIEITVQRPGEQPLTSNIKVQQSDIELLESLKQMGK